MRPAGLSGFVSSGPVAAKAILRVAGSLAAAVAAVAAVASAAWAAAPEFLTLDTTSKAATVTLLAVGDNQTLVGPPVRAVDADGDTLEYSLSGTDASLFTIDSDTGQISRMPRTPRGVYRVKVSVSDGTDEAEVDVEIRVTSGGRYPSESAWVQTRAMTAADGTANDWFGISVDATDDVIVVGAHGANGGVVYGPLTGSGPGSAYVFDAGSGAQLARLDSPNPINTGGFGWSVAIVDDTIVVGAYREPVSSNAREGRAYVFVKPATGWADTSTPTATLEPAAADYAPTGGTSPPEWGIRFGSAVALSDDGNTLVVGARQWEHVGGGDDHSTALDRDGAVFVFPKPATGWANADTDDTGVVRLFAGTRTVRDDGLGATVAISGDGNTIAASAIHNGGTPATAGYVYVFTKPDTGWVSTTYATGTPPRMSVTNRFTHQRLGSEGVSLSYDGSTLVAGAGGDWRKDRTGAALVPDDYVGAAYVFARPSRGWADATETAKLSTFGHKWDGFGSGVAISGSGNKIAVSNKDSRSSNYRGSAYVFTRPSGGWVSDTDGVGSNIRVLTLADADTDASHRYGFGGIGLAFVGENKLVVGQIAYVAALVQEDGLSSSPVGGLYGANVDMSNRANVPQGSAYLFKLRPGPTGPGPTGPGPTGPDPDPDPTEPPPPPPPPPPPEFEDVDDDSVHAASIKTVARLKITTGTSATTFSPAQTVTRAQLATFMARTWTAAGQECPSSGVVYFDDVAAGSTHASGIDCMSALGVTAGTSARTFSPSQTVTRAQMATFMARMWTAAGQECPASGALSFTDVAAGSTHAAGIDCISALGITRGTTATTFSPSQTVTRAQMATFLARFYSALTAATA